MADEQEKPVSPKPTIRIRAKPKPKAPEREQSTIGFPYYDLEAAIGVARAILNAGALSVTREQLAGLLDSSTNSGTFLTKMSATRMFGLISVGAGQVELTDLGSSILDSDDRRARRARAEAFLNVPLFRKVYDEFRGRLLPPRPLPMEHAFVKLGVSNNQKTTARLTFDRSAAFAGYFSAGNDRLIEPIIGGAAPTRPLGVADMLEPTDEPQPEPSRARTQAKSDLPHFMHMLIEALPDPGSTWTVEGRAKWLQAAATAFDLSYMGDGTITISAKGEHGEGKDKS